MRVRVVEIQKKYRHFPPGSRALKKKRDSNAFWIFRRRIGGRAADLTRRTLGKAKPNRPRQNWADQFWHGGGTGPQELGVVPRPMSLCARVSDNAAGGCVVLTGAGLTVAIPIDDR